VLQRRNAFVSCRRIRRPNLLLEFSGPVTELAWWSGGRVAMLNRGHAAQDRSPFERNLTGDGAREPQPTSQCAAVTTGRGPINAPSEAAACNDGAISPELEKITATSLSRPLTSSRLPDKELREGREVRQLMERAWVFSLLLCWVAVLLSGKQPHLYPRPLGLVIFWFS
jgi:hypothetical protein